MNAKSLGTGHPLKQNSAAGYWATFRAFLNIAYRNKFIKENPNDYLEKIKTIPTDKETLSLDEIQKLIETPCEIEVLKKAVIFDCLTGLRRSDILRLEWEKICATSDDAQYLDMSTQKTGSEGFIFISDKLMEFIGPRGKGLVFKGFKPYMTNYPMKKWFKQAGITKHVTFHGLRQTVAALMVIVHRLLMVCALADRHLRHHKGKAVLLISRTICVASILHLRMTWMITV